MYNYTLYGSRVWVLINFNYYNTIIKNKINTLGTMHYMIKK